MFFIKEYKAKRIKEPDNFINRDRILKSNNPNLLFLLRKRFGWMKNYIDKKKIVIELGSGNGCLKKIINKKNIILTDIV